MADSWFSLGTPMAVELCSWVDWLQLELREKWPCHPFLKMAVGVCTISGHEVYNYIYIYIICNITHIHHFWYIYNTYCFWTTVCIIYTCFWGPRWFSLACFHLERLVWLFKKKQGFKSWVVGQSKRNGWNGQWPFQEPKLEVPTIYKAYVRAI